MKKIILFICLLPLIASCSRKVKKSFQIHNTTSYCIEEAMIALDAKELETYAIAASGKSESYTIETDIPRYEYLFSGVSVSMHIFSYSKARIKYENGLHLTQSGSFFHNNRKQDHHNIYIREHAITFPDKSAPFFIEIQ